MGNVIKRLSFLAVLVPFRFVAGFYCSPHKYPDVGSLQTSPRLFGCFFIQQIGLFTISTGTNSRFGFSRKMLFGWCLFSDFSLLRLFLDCKFEFLRLFRRRHAQKVKLKNDENEIKTLMLYSRLLSALCTSSVCTWFLVFPWWSVYCVKSTYKSLQSGFGEEKNEKILLVTIARISSGFYGLQIKSNSELDLWAKWMRNFVSRNNKFYNFRSAASFIALSVGSQRWRKREMNIFCLLHTIPPHRHV